METAKGSEAPRKTQAVIGLYLMTQVLQDVPRLEPSHCAYLVPDQALSIVETKFDHMLLLLRYGRSKEEVDTLVQSLARSFPLMIQKQTLFASFEHAALYRLKKRFLLLNGVKIWTIQDAIAEFKGIGPCLAYLRSQVHSPFLQKSYNKKNGIYSHKYTWTGYHSRHKSLDKRGKEKGKRTPPKIFDGLLKPQANIREANLLQIVLAEE